MTREYVSRKLFLFHDYHSQVETERDGESMSERIIHGKNPVLKKNLHIKTIFILKKPAKIYFWIMAIFIHENSIVSFESRKF